MRLGLIGRGISKSLAGRLHIALGRVCGLDVSYDLFDTEDDETLSFLNRLTKCASDGSLRP